MQKKKVYNDIPDKYLQKISEQRNKLKFVRKDSIENYKAFKNGYTNANNGLKVIGTYPEEIVKDSYNPGKKVRICFRSVR